MADIDLIGVPFDGHGRSGTAAGAARVLHDAGLIDAFDHHHVVEHDCLLGDEAALPVVTDLLNARVGASVAAGLFPFVYGGDCSTLVGIAAGVREHVGDFGLVFVGGTGRALSGLPAFRPGQLAVLGLRDDALADSGGWLAPMAEVADDPAGTGRRAVEQLARNVDRWWLHVDLDVLDPHEFAAQGLPDAPDEPGGLTWDQLTDTVVSLFGSRAHCIGASIAIYDPDQDPDRADAAKIVTFVRNALARTTISP